MIFATGDCHGDFQRFGSKHFPQQKGMGRDDYMIILGDFGGVWNGSSEERKRLDWLNEKPFTTLFVSGNHENYWMLRELPVEDWHGGRVQRVRPNILHLMRGQIYDIGGRTFFSMGGATSHDVEDGILDQNAPDFRTRYLHLLLAGRRRFRIIGKSWWQEELPSDEEYAAALDALERAGWKADPLCPHQHRPADGPALPAGRAHRFSGDRGTTAGVWLLAVWALPRQPGNRQEAHSAV